jgi:hypothetical protein
MPIWSPFGAQCGEVCGEVLGPGFTVNSLVRIMIECIRLSPNDARGAWCA